MMSRVDADLQFHAKCPGFPPPEAPAAGLCNWVGAIDTSCANTWEIASSIL